MVFECTVEVKDAQNVDIPGVLGGMADTMGSIEAAGM